MKCSSVIGRSIRMPPNHWPLRVTGTMQPFNWSGGFSLRSVNRNENEFQIALDKRCTTTRKRGKTTGIVLPDTHWRYSVGFDQRRSILWPRFARNADKFQHWAASFARNSLNFISNQVPYDANVDRLDWTTWVDGQALVAAWAPVRNLATKMTRSCEIVMICGEGYSKLNNLCKTSTLRGK